ncbi:hypothetical protein J2X68_001121 [Streptomyces sp. 3330]|nr:hypothetical protein [Streptomyces sp. 3330]MDR6974443.1 hypothetical protein [Streptomyces sp. 3330]
MCEPSSLKEEFGDRDTGGAVSGTTVHGSVAFAAGGHSRQDDHFGAAT